MAIWLYQMNQSNWPPGRYRLEIWEGERWAWPVGRKVSGGRSPEAGDSVVFFYGRSSGTDPGFYGWAVILEWLEEDSSFYFRPVPPSDTLKMRPWWDAAADTLADRIRGKVKQGTMWLVPDDCVADLRGGLLAWCSGVVVARGKTRR